MRCIFVNYLLEPYDVRMPERPVIDNLSLHILIHLHIRSSSNYLNTEHTDL
jgi:hypothetical protein